MKAITMMMHMTENVTATVAIMVAPEVEIYQHKVQYQTGLIGYTTS